MVLDNGWEEESFSLISKVFVTRNVHVALSLNLSFYNSILWPQPFLLIQHRTHSSV